MNNEASEGLNDFNAELNFSGKRSVWVNNAYKIDYVLKKCRRHLKGSRACDIGLGNGYTLESYLSRGFKVVGIDNSSCVIEYLKKKHADKGERLVLRCADITSFKTEDAMDVVSCFDILEHLPGNAIYEALTAVSSMLNDDGVFLCTLPIGENPADNMMKCPACGHVFHKIGHHHFFDTADAAAALLSKNFTLLSMGFVPKKRFNIVWLDCLYTAFRMFCYEARKIRKMTTWYFVLKKRP